MADPLEPTLQGSFVYADRPELEPGIALPGSGPPPIFRDYEGRDLEAEVVLGLRLPLFRTGRGEDGPAFVLEFETGVFSRLHMAPEEQDLISSDFRVGLPLSGSYGGWSGRLAIRHLSSHLGDEFVDRFFAPVEQVSQDGIEFILARRIGDGLRLYGGGEWNLNVEPVVVERTLVRWGAEFEDDGAAGQMLWPHAAWDFRLSSLTDRVAGLGVAGVAFRVRSVVIRLEGRGHFGPSAMGHLRHFDETYWGLGLRIVPFPAY